MTRRSENARRPTSNEVQRLGSVDGSRLLLSEPDEILAKDTVRDVFLLEATLLLTMHGDSLRRCPEQRCGQRLFVRVRRQLYCSHRCAQRVNKRAERAGSKKAKKKRR